LSWLLSVISILASCLSQSDSACFFAFKSNLQFQNYLILHRHNLLVSATFNRIFLLFHLFWKLFSVRYQTLFFLDFEIFNGTLNSIWAYILISSPCLLLRRIWMVLLSIILISP
jgi:hypothetical protein